MTTTTGISNQHPRAPKHPIVPPAQPQPCPLPNRIHLTTAIRTTQPQPQPHPPQGYGFITPTSGGPDVFVHQSEVKRDGFRFLIRGEEVQFRVEETDAGRRAFDVTGAACVPGIAVCLFVCLFARLSIDFWSIAFVFLT